MNYASMKIMSGEAAGLRSREAKASALFGPPHLISALYRKSKNIYDPTRTGPPWKITGHSFIEEALVLHGSGFEITKSLTCHYL